MTVKNTEEHHNGLKAIYKQSERWSYHTLLPVSAQDALFNAANVGDEPLSKIRLQSIDVETWKIKRENPSLFHLTNKRSNGSNVALSCVKNK